MKRSYWIAGGVVGLAMIAALATYFLIGAGNVGSALAGKAAPAAPPSQNEGLGANRLALGTFYLEGTGMAVTPEQAAKLLPLWQMLKALYSSDASAQAEINAVLTQLEKGMTAEQMQAIRDMNLTPEQMVELMQSLGIEMQTRPSGEGTQGQIPGAFQGQPPGVIEGQGGFRGGGVAIPGGAMPSFSEADIAAMRATREASGGAAERMMGGRANTAIIERLIEMLQARAVG
ncbi:MAG: hypothetical protein HPY83_18600 [Anaerolineae bacterium]|nr:hypothetical protein [Anaerolineae bacterium]